MKKNIFTVDGRFYYGWIILVCAAMPMFINVTIKGNCAPLFMEMITEELNISRTAYTQTNTIMTVSMMIASLFIGKIFRMYPIKWVFFGTSLLTTVTWLFMSRATSLTQLLIISAIQGIGWAGNTSLSTSLMVGNWFGPKIKGTALSISMLTSGAGALIWVNLVQSVIANHGWRTGYLAMAAINAICCVMALLIIDKPSMKGYSTRIGDPTPDETATGEKKDLVDYGVPATKAIRTARWWFQWLAAFLTMVGAAGFAFHCKAYLAEINGGDSAAAAALYSAALGTLMLGKFLLGAATDILKVKRTSVIAPFFFVGVFVCLALAQNNPAIAKGMIPFYMIGGSIATVIPFIINGRNFGQKDYSILQGWMIIAGNAGQIVGPTVASAVYDMTGNYTGAWVIFAGIMFLVALFYFLSTRVSTKKIAEWGYVAVD